jgi:hypothetical protein
VGVTRTPRQSHLLGEEKAQMAGLLLQLLQLLAAAAAANVRLAPLATTCLCGSTEHLQMLLAVLQHQVQRCVLQQLLGGHCHLMRGRCSMREHESCRLTAMAAAAAAAAVTAACKMRRQGQRQLGGRWLNVARQHQRAGEPHLRAGARALLQQMMTRHPA